MDLADFRRLKVLNLRGNTVRGDICDIREHDFPALESLRLQGSVLGGIRYEFQNISEVPGFMHAVHLLLQRSPAMFESALLSRAFHLKLSDDSPDWYDGFVPGYPPPPFHMQFVQAGSRLGWSWTLHDYNCSCEINCSIHSQAVKAVAMKHTWRNCSVLNSV
jgi:hypothetical protein